MVNDIVRRVRHGGLSCSICNMQIPPATIGYITDNASVNYYKLIDHRSERICADCYLRICTNRSRFDPDIYKIKVADDIVLSLTNNERAERVMELQETSPQSPPGTIEIDNSVQYRYTTTSDVVVEPTTNDLLIQILAQLKDMTVAITKLTAQQGKDDIVIKR